MFRAAKKRRQCVSRHRHDMAKMTWLKVGKNKRKKKERERKTDGEREREK